MQKLLLLILWISISIGVKAQGFKNDEPDTIIITYRDLSFGKKKYKASYRLQVSRQEGKYLIEGTNADKLPAHFKKFKITGSNSETRINFTREEAYELEMPVIDAEVAKLTSDTVFFRDKAAKEKLFRDHKRNTEKFFSGKHAGSFFKNNWVPLYSFTTKEPDPALAINIGSTLFKKVRYKTDHLPAAYASQLPVVDTATCTPFNRFHELREMKGYGIGKFKYTPYRMPCRQTVHQKFEIYFDKNSAEAQAESIQSVIDYLRNNSYSILHASVEGYSSIEGDDQRNTRLQQKRVRVLLKVLQQYNNEPILSDTVIINSGYKIFRETIQNTSYQWLDSLSDEGIRNTVNSNYILLASLESFLKPQRKAVLKLAVAKRIEGAEVFERFKKDFERLEKKLNPKFSNDAIQAEVEAQVMGMLEYLFALRENDLITSAEVTELLDHAWSKEIVRVMAVYHHIIQFEKKTFRDSLYWNDLSNQHSYGNLFTEAQANLISLISNPGYQKQREKFKQQLVDIQTYCFDYTEMNWISIESLCEVQYPDHPDFHGYKLNQLAFLQELTKSFNVPCEKLRLADVEKIERYTDSWLDANRSKETFFKSEQEQRIKNNTIKPGLVIEKVKLRSDTIYKYHPWFGFENYSPYLFYLKKLFVKDETSIAQHIIASDNLIEFDIYALVQYHIRRWGPSSNYFADPEVQLVEMDKVISLLKKIGSSRMCTPARNELFLDYHLKALHYINQYFELGNAQQVDIAQRSLQFITNYYSKNASLVTPRLSMYILLQLNAFHWIPGKYDGTWYAWNLLKNIAGHRILSGDEMYLFRKYNQYYVPVDSKN